jgi:hypothetical protein
MIEVNTLLPNDIIEIEIYGREKRLAVFTGISPGHTRLDKPFKADGTYPKDQQGVSSWGQGDCDWYLYGNQSVIQRLIAHSWETCPQCGQWTCGLTTSLAEQPS